jgi:hypothetical protein
VEDLQTTLKGEREWQQLARLRHLETTDKNEVSVREHVYLWQVVNLTAASRVETKHTWLKHPRPAFHRAG